MRERGKETRNQGKIQNPFDYWADGNLRYIEEKVSQPFRYTGAYHDDEANLYYLRARHYSPPLRRFLQRDPILFEGGINLYLYTDSDFVNYGDWWGFDADPSDVIRSLYRNILEHLEKIRREPNSQAVNHWKREIENFKGKIEAIARRAVKKRKGSIEENVDKYLKKILGLGLEALRNI